MVKQARRQHKEELKREAAVNLVEEQGRIVTDVARSLGVNRSQIEHWPGQYGQASAPSR